MISILRPIVTVYFIIFSIFCLADDTVSTEQQTPFTVIVETSVQQITDIKTIKLKQSQLTPEIESFATLVNLVPLLQARATYFNALAQQKQAQLQLDQAQRDMQRVQKLHQEQAVSKRKLVQHKNQLELTKAHFQASRLNSTTLHLQTEAQWGKKISHWFLSENNPSFLALSQSSQQLYLVHLPLTIKNALNSISLQDFSASELTQTAQLISSAPIFTAAQQAGTPYFYLSESSFKGHYPRVIARLPTQENQITGVIIPSSALIWHLGQAFVYIQVEDEQFKRIKIDHKKLINADHYFIQHVLQQNDLLVINGAQMLLSEEFRGQIPAEDDDDDDDDD